MNEPVANACRRCGRWPSLFDLEQGAIEVEEPPVEDAYQAEMPVPQEIDVHAEDYSGIPELKPELELEPEAEQPPRGWSRRIGSLIVPLLVLLYIVISIVADR